MLATVTGAAGFIGSRLAAKLLDEGARVRAIDRISDYYDPARKRANLEPLARHDGFEFLEADLADGELRAALKGVDAVFHLAAQPGVRGGWGSDFGIYFRDNVLATQRLLDASSDAGVRRVVFASSSSVYGDAQAHPTPETAGLQPVSPYGATKLAGENLCDLYTRARDLDVVRLRYFTVFGPGQRPDMAISLFSEAAVAGDPIDVFGDGLQERELTYVDDVVAATIAAAERGTKGAAYNIGGGVRATVLELAELVGRQLDLEPVIRHLPILASEPRRTSSDTTLARQELGFDPRTPLAEGIARQLAVIAATRPPRI